MQEGKFKALKEGERIDFWGNPHPKCPHCGSDFDIHDGEAWFLYDEQNGPHALECQECDEEFSVSSIATWTFSTDEQDED